jgi:hypothetical protein
MLIFGISIFSIVYFGWVQPQHLCFRWNFALYGIYAAASEGISKRGSAIFQRKILRPLSAPILLFKAFHYARQWQD